MFAYYCECLWKECIYTLRHPRRNDYFELRHAFYQFWDGLTTPITLLTHFLKNVWIYRKILWRDRNWDWGYIYRLLELKLRLMSQEFRENGHHVGSELSAQRLLVAAELCRRIYEDNYSDIPLKRHEAKWGKLNWGSEPIEGSNCHRLLISRPNATSEKLHEQERKETLAIHQAADSQKQADLDYLCKLLSKYSFGWWD